MRLLEKLETHPQFLIFGFLGILIYTFFFFHFPDWIALGPVSVHRWRQADSASQALCYVHNGLRFFQHQIHNLDGGNGQAVSEFPITYFLSAAISQITGFKPVILRGIHYLIVLVGAWSYAKLIASITTNYWLALSSAAVYWGSPVLAFYSFNFLPNAPALGLLLAGAGCYAKFFSRQRLSLFWGSVLLVSLAGLLKPTMLVAWLAWMAAYIVGKYGIRDSKSEWQKWFPPARIFWSGSLLVLLVNAGWISWVQYYDTIHHAQNFLVRIFPVWHFDADQNQAIWDMIVAKRLPRFYLPVTFSILGLGMLLNFFFYRQLPLPIRLFVVFLFLGVLCVFLLFFVQFQHHDYYFIDLMPALLSSFALNLYLLQKLIRQVRYPDSLWPRPYFFYIPFLILLISFVNMNLVASRKHMEKVTAANHPDMANFNPDFYASDELRAYVRSIGLSYRHSPVISIPDGSPNASLYYLDLRGYSHKNGNIPEEKLQKARTAGCQYVVVSDKKLLQIPEVRAICRKQIGAFRNSIFFFEWAGH